MQESGLLKGEREDVNFLQKRSIEKCKEHVNNAVVFDLEDERWYNHLELRILCNQYDGLNGVQIWIKIHQSMFFPKIAFNIGIKLRFGCCCTICLQ